MPLFKMIKSSTVLNHPIIANDGEAYYFAKLFKDNAQSWLDGLMNELTLEPQNITIFGHRYMVPRLVSFYGDPNISYTYSGQTQQALIWTPLLFEIKNRIENLFDAKFNCVLCNLYRNGQDSMGFHSDNEKELGPQPIIASLSLGEQRNFVFKHKITKERIVVKLDNGSILLMRGSLQDYWLHSVPKTKLPKGIRLNLTFRLITNS